MPHNLPQGCKIWASLFTEKLVWAGETLFISGTCLVHVWYMYGSFSAPL